MKEKINVENVERPYKIKMYISYFGYPQENPKFLNRPQLIRDTQYILTKYHAI
jgi:hypothetical protein